MAKLAKEQISPYVREMEKDGKLKESVVRMLFDNGVNLNFTNAELNENIS